MPQDKRRRQQPSTQRGTAKAPEADSLAVEAFGRKGAALREGMKQFNPAAQPRKAIGERLLEGPRKAAKAVGGAVSRALSSLKAKPR